MIVDDVSAIREVMRRILEMSGYRVVAEAADGVEAVAKYAELLPHITLMDICLPNKNGIDATRDIMNLDKDAKVVMFSALQTEAVKRAATESGARDCLTKPCRIDHLKKVLHTVLHN